MPRRSPSHHMSASTYGLGFGCTVLTALADTQHGYPRLPTSGPFNGQTRCSAGLPAPQNSSLSLYQVAHCPFHSPPLLVPAASTYSAIGRLLSSLAAALATALLYRETWGAWPPSWKCLHSLSRNAQKKVQVSTPDPFLQASSKAQEPSIYGISGAVLTHASKHEQPNPIGELKPYRVSFCKRSPAERAGPHVGRPESSGAQSSETYLSRCMERHCHC